jgi:peptide/nickel transport system permease protein
MSAEASVQTPSPPAAELPATWTETKRPWVRLRERARGNVPLAVGAFLLLAYVAIAVAAVVRFGSGLVTLSIDPSLANQIAPSGPDAAHPFGVLSGQSVGFDILASLFQATPIDLALLGGPILLATVIGLLVGAYSGLVGGPIDLALTFVSDLLTTVPPFFLVMVLFLGVHRFFLPEWYLPVFGVLAALVLWPYHARPVRARAAQIAGENYVEAARAAGSKNGRLLRRHVIPNSMFPMFAQIPVDLYNLVFVLTVFPFLYCTSSTTFGYLTALPTTFYPEWGFLLAEGVCYGWSPLAASDFWWMYAFPAAAIVLFGIAVALVCDGAERLMAGP